MGTYRFSQSAARDLDEVFDFIEVASPNAASRRFDTLHQKCQRFAEFPRMGKDYASIRPGLRGFIVDCYVLFYYPYETGIDIVRVINGRHDLKALFRELSDNPAS